MNNKYEYKKYYRVQEIILDLVFCWCFSGTIAKILDFLLYFMWLEKKYIYIYIHNKMRENFKICSTEKLVIFLFGEWN